MVRVEELRQRVEEVEERLGVGIEVDEHETAPALGPHRAQREIVGYPVEVVGVDDLDDPTVERVPPAVEGASERSVGHVTRAVGEAGTSVQARIREGG